MTFLHDVRVDPYPKSSSIWTPIVQNPTPKTEDAEVYAITNIAIKNMVNFDSVEMEKFRPDRFYRIVHDSKIDSDHNLVTIPSFAGLVLAAEYYSQKYQTNIELPLSGVCEVDEFFDDIQDHLAKARITEGDYRQAFILGARGPHATPIIYVREDGEESLLHADSKGLDLQTVQLIQKTHYLTGINVYAVEKPRQADLYSCFMDALALCVDATKVHSNTGKYAIPNLLTRLKLRSEPRDGYFATKLPDVLLKTAQIPAFIRDHQEIDSSEIIHKTETFQQFKNRYTDKVVIYKENGEAKTTNISSYVRKKGIKLAETMEIQFYLKQLKIEGLKKGHGLSADEQIDFIRQAKMAVRLKTENLHHFSKNFYVN